MTFQEDGDGGDAAAHVDHRGADLFFVFRQGREAAGIGAEQRSHHIQVAAFHGQLQVLQRRRLDRHGMHGHADALAEHAGRVLHAARFIDHIGGGRGLDDLMPVQLAAGAAIIQQGTQMSVADQGAIQRHHGAAGHRYRLAAIDADQDILQPGIGHVLGRGHAIADGVFGLVQAGDGAGFQAAGLAQAGAQHFQRAGFGLADDTDDLGGADIQRRYQSGAIGWDFVVHAQFQRLVHVSFPRSTSFFSPFLRMKKKWVGERRSISAMSRSRMPLSMIR